MIGETVSHFRILERLGGGGMGVVYKAEDLKLGRTVALKFLSPGCWEGSEARERFVREARAASALQHPAICTVHEIDESDSGAIFICMAYCDGSTLKRLLQRGALSVAQILDVAAQVASGLERAHEAGIIHRDIKPANIIVSERGEARIVDFGLAKLVAEAGTTRTGKVVGTIAYMSPEQASGERVDERTDIWSLGVILYEALAGRRPFPSDTGPALLYAIVHRHPPSLAGSRPDLPTELIDLVDGCLQKDPDRRIQSAAELRARLEAVRSSAGELRSTTTAVIGRPPARRLRRLGSGLAAVVALAAVVVATVPSTRGSLARLLGGHSLPRDRHVAVLPFANEIDDASTWALYDGLQDLVASTLVRLKQFSPALLVVPLEDVLAENVREAGAAREVFGVNLVVTGVVRQEREETVLRLSLLDAGTLEQLGTARVSPRGAGGPVAQERIVQALAELLRLPLPDEALALLEAGGTGVDSAFDLYLQGRGYLIRDRPGESTDDLERAATLFREAIAADPSFALAHAGLGQVQLRRYEVDRDPRWLESAGASGRRAIELDELLPEGHVTLGLALLEGGRWEDAAASFQRALALEPGGPRALRGLARALEAQGRRDEAERAFEEAIAARPDDWVTYRGAGEFYWRAGRHREALDMFDRVIAIRPDNPFGYNNLGAALFSLGRAGEARLMFERSLALVPNYRALANLGTLEFYQQRYDRAAGYYERALELNDSDYQVWGYLAECWHWSGGAAERARQAYQRAAYLAERQLQVNPGDPTMLCDLASYSAKLGNRPKAELYLGRAAALPDLRPAELLVVAEIWEQLGEREEALAYVGRWLRSGEPPALIDAYPGFADLRRDERYAAMVERLHGDGSPAQEAPGS